jgi:UDP-N-acetylbacillosamine N-acetyltransferase
LLFVDENAKDRESFLGFPVVRSMPVDADSWVYMPCSGDNRIRLDQTKALEAANLPIATIVSPTATIGHGSSIAAGCFVGHHAHVGPLTRLGSACIINTGAVVEHDCTVECGTHISVNSCFAGYCHIGDRVYCGIGSSTIDRLSVGNDITLRAGGVLVESVDLPGIYVGVPARRRETRP